jgi:hypothetical protein
MANWFGRYCTHQTPHWDGTGVHVCGVLPTSTICKHKDNPSDIEGGCCASRCPLNSYVHYAGESKDGTPLRVAEEDTLNTTAGDPPPVYPFGHYPPDCTYTTSTNKQVSLNLQVLLDILDSLPKPPTILSMKIDIIRNPTLPENYILLSDSVAKALENALEKGV